MSWFKKSSGDDPRPAETDSAGARVEIPPAPGVRANPGSDTVRAPAPPRDIQTRPPSPPTQPQDSKMAEPGTIAQMGSVALSSSDARQLLQQLSTEDRERALKEPETLRSFLNGELWRMVTHRKAEAAGFHMQPDVQMKVRRAAEQAIASLYLADLTMPAPSFPEDVLVRQYYDANLAQFTVPAQFRLAQIYLAAAADGAELAGRDVKGRAEEMVREARQGGDFAAMCRTHSEHTQSASAGGEIGWTAQFNLLPEIQSVVIAMNEGQISDVVRTSSGYHILKLLERRPATVSPFDQVQDAIRQALIRRQRDILSQQVVSDVMRETPPTINEIALRDIMQALKP
jgi:hypothetical protein